MKSLQALTFVSGARRRFLLELQLLVESDVHGLAISEIFSLPFLPLRCFKENLICMLHQTYTHCGKTSVRNANLQKLWCKIDFGVVSSKREFSFDDSSSRSCNKRYLNPQIKGFLDVTTCMIYLAPVQEGYTIISTNSKVTSVFQTKMHHKSWSLFQVRQHFRILESSSSSYPEISYIPM